MAVTVWLSNMDSILSMGQNFYVYLHPKNAAVPISALGLRPTPSGSSRWPQRG